MKKIAILAFAALVSCGVTDPSPNPIAVCKLGCYQWKHDIGEYNKCFSTCLEHQEDGDSDVESVEISSGSGAGMDAY